MSFPRYPKYKDSGVEWLGQIPAEWDSMALRRFGCMVQAGPFGSQLHAEEYVFGGTPLVNPINMVNGRIVPDDHVTVANNVLQRLPHQVLRRGDIVFSRRGELGRCALVTATEAGWLCGTGSMIVRIEEGDFDPGYLSAYLSLGLVRQYFESYSVGAVMDSLSSATLLSLPLVVPPLPEQTAIAAFLDREVAKIEALVAEQERLIELLKEKRQAVISHAVTKGLNPDAPMKDSGVEWLGEIPAHWATTRLKYATSIIVDCPHETPIYAEDGPYLVIRTADLCQGNISTDAMFRVSESEYLNRIRRQSLRANDIVYGREGERWGHAGLVPADDAFCLGQRMMQFRADGDSVVPAFLMWQLNSKAVYVQGDVDTVGATSPHVNVATIRNFFLALPPLSEQLAIVDFVSTQVALLDSLTAEAQRAIELLQERRTALISAAVTGQIDVRDVERRAA